MIFYRERAYIREYYAYNNLPGVESIKLWQPAGIASSKFCLWSITDTECQVWVQMLISTCLDFGACPVTNANVNK